MIVIEQDSRFAEFFLEHLILGPQVFDRFLPLAIDPTGTK